MAAKKEAMSRRKAAVRQRETIIVHVITEYLDNTAAWDRLWDLLHQRVAERIACERPAAQLSNRTCP
jgi:hypothetical protein